MDGEAIDQKPATDRPQLRVLDGQQLKFVRLYCSGGGTVENTAALVDVTTATAKRWMRRGSPVSVIAPPVPPW